MLPKVDPNENALIPVKIKIKKNNNMIPTIVKIIAKIAEEIPRDSKVIETFLLFRYPKA